MTVGLRFVVCLQEAGWNQAQRVQQTVFPPSASTNWKIILQKTRRAFRKRIEVFPYIFSIFQPGLRSQPGLSTVVEIQPGLSCKRAIAFMCVSG